MLTFPPGCMVLRVQRRRIVILEADLDPYQQDSWVETARLRPPLNREALEIPVYSLRAWLEGRREQEISDSRGTSFLGQEGLRSPCSMLAWTDDCRVINPSDIHPGDTILLPADYGGCDQYGWAPHSEEPVEDILTFALLIA